MYYYKEDNVYYASETPLKRLTPISEEEYEQTMEQLRLEAEQEERKMKEEELRRLLRELYPDEEE